MEIPDGSCIYENRVYSNGYRFRGYMKGMVCRCGEWIDLDGGSEEAKPSLAYVYH